MCPSHTLCNYICQGPACLDGHSLSWKVQRPSRAQGRIHWYTSMVGKKATLREVRAALLRRRCPALRTTQLCQGRTSRWAIAWSWAADTHAAAAPLPRGGPALAAAATAAAAAASGPARCALGIHKP